MNNIVLLLHYSKYGEIFKHLTQKLDIPEEFFHIIPDGTGGEERLLRYVREKRPIGVILDPAYAPEQIMENICKSVSDTIGTYDMHCILYSLGDRINFPGVGVITKEDIEDILRS